MEVFSVAALAALLKKLLDLVKQLQAGDNGSVLTQVVAFAGGIGLIWLAAASPLMGGVGIGGVTFSDFDWAAKILAGLALGAAASTIHDSQVAVDPTQPGALPSLFASLKSNKSDDSAVEPGNQAVPGPQAVITPSEAATVTRKPVAKKAPVAVKAPVVTPKPAAKRVKKS